MKKTAAFQPLGWLFVLLLMAQCTPANTPETNPEEEGEKSLPSDWMYLQRAYPHDRIDQQAYRDAFRQMKTALAGAGSRSAGQWEQAGPLNTGGRITDLALHPTDQGIIYAGTSNGGVFKTDDGGLSWAPVFENQGSNSIGDVALAPSDPNTLYVGTGEANGSFISGAFFGDGIFKSTNGGATWEHVGLENTNHIGRIAVDPADANRVYVAAAGVLYGTSPDRGIYRTLDGGENWEQVLFVTDSTSAIDVVVNPQNANLVYAATWERVRRPWGRNYGGFTSRIYRSFDGGENWTQLTNGLPADGAARGRIGLAIAPSQPQVLYASYTTNPVLNRFDGIYKSTDAGTSWQLVEPANGELENVFSTFGWFFGNLRVNPSDPDEVFCLGVPLYRSLDGGSNWFDNTNGMHVDFHALEFHPQNPEFIVAGNDGGLYLSHDGGSVWQKIETIPNTLIYNAEIDFLQPERLYCGLQDQGTNRTPGGLLNDFERILGGDGFHVIVDPTDNNFIYCEYQFGVLFRSTNGGQNLEYIFNADGPNDRTNWNTPIAMHPANPQTLYYGANRLWQTTDRGDNWQPISPDLTKGLHASGSLSYGTISCIAVAPGDPQIIYVGTDDGNVQATFNGGTNWENISEGLPNRYVTSVAVHPNNANTAYVTCSGFRDLDYQPHVLRTQDGGETWEDVSANLPEIPVNDLVIDPEQPDVLYLGNDMGVWYSVNSGETWEVLGDNFPLTIVNDLVLHAPTKKLLAATFGRSMLTYDVTDIAPASSTVEPVFAFGKLEIFPNPVNANTTVRFELPAASEGRLQVLTIHGQLVQTLGSQRFSKGKNEIRWNAAGLPGGTYLLRLQLADRVLTGKVVR